MTKKRISTKGKWPPELQGPFPMYKLEHAAMEAAGEAGNAEQLYTRILSELWEAETKRSVTLIAQFFNKAWPQSEGEWLRLIFLICKAFEAPGFQSKRPGRKAPELSLLGERVENLQATPLAKLLLTSRERSNCARSGLTRRDVGQSLKPPPLL
jgi:hypothetical protein